MNNQLTDLHKAEKIIAERHTRRLEIVTKLHEIIAVCAHRVYPIEKAHSTIEEIRDRPHEMSPNEMNEQIESQRAIIASIKPSLKEDLNIILKAITLAKSNVESAIEYLSKED